MKSDKQYIKELEEHLEIERLSHEADRVKMTEIEAGNQLLNDNLCNTQELLLKAEQENQRLKDEVLKWGTLHIESRNRISELEETIARIEKEVSSSNTLVNEQDAKLEAIIKENAELKHELNRRDNPF